MRIKTNSLSFSIAIICISILVISCNSSNNLVSSFSKRKYTKGYFINTPSSPEPVISKTKKHEIENVATSALSSPVIIVIKDNNTQHKQAPVVSSSIKEELRPVNKKPNNIAEFNTALRIMRPDTSHIAQDTIDEFYKERKTNRILGAIGMTAAVAGIVFIFLTDFILAPIFILIGLVISAIGIKRGSNSLLALFGFIISTIGVIILVDILITSH
jgi:hypothetical protein